MKEIRRTVRAAAMILALLIAGTALGGGTIDVPAIRENALGIDPIPPRTETNREPEIQVHNGEISRDGQTDSYWVTMPYDGRLRAEISELYSGKAVTLLILDRLGQKVVSDGYCENGEGVTAKDLKAGDRYEIRVEQNTGYSTYQLTIGLPGEAMDVSGLTEVSDRISFTDQRNVYTFTVPRDGRYRFELFDMMKGFAPEIRVFDRLGEETAGDGYCENHEGVTLKNLKAGETYQIQVRQGSGTGNYRMLIGHQKEPVNVSAGTVVRDSVEYNDQRNVYLLEAEREGEVTIRAEGLMSQTALAVRVTNGLLEEIGSDGYFTNGEEITVRNVSRGSRIQIEAIQNTGFGSYTLLIE